MCGRFVLSSTPVEIADRFELEEMPEWPPRYNIAPTQRIPIIRAPDGTRECSLARWGLIPAWSKEPKTEYSTFNARAESVAVKPAFRDAFRHRRCLIPVDGFFEWSRMDASLPGGDGGQQCAQRFCCVDPSSVAAYSANPNQPVLTTNPKEGFLMAKRIALVAGATGLVGRECLRLLAEDANVEEVRALVRKPLSAETQALGIRECRVDFDRLEEHANWFEVDWVFCAIGTTMRQAGSQDAFRRVDFDYPLSVARTARAAGARHFLLVSAVGADARSRVFYNRVKGELEEAVSQLGYPSLTIARPSLLLGERSPPRIGEEIGKRLAWLFPPKWKPVQASQVASALLRAAHANVPGVQILDNTALRDG